MDNSIALITTTTAIRHPSRILAIRYPFRNVSKNRFLNIIIRSHYSLRPSFKSVQKYIRKKLVIANKNLLSALRDIFSHFLFLVF